MTFAVVKTGITQEGRPCACPAPENNVIIDPVAFPNGATLTQLQTQYPFFAGNAMTNTCLSIQGHLIVNKSFTIDGGEIIMNPGAQITVVGGAAVVFAIRNVNQNGGVHGCAVLPQNLRAILPEAPLAIQAPERVSVYPNPGQDEFFFNVPLTESGWVEVRIYSLTGKQVYRSVLPAGGPQRLHLASLPKGVFLYEVWNGGTRLLNGKLSKIN